MEGAGVKLHRAFGFGTTSEFDPFLLFDDFRNDRPDDYQAGFPWHPHRGIETITYILEGDVEHQDSIGNRGYIGKGDLQWMTAGSGILHQEMPQGNSKGQMFGFQLWLNLPANDKMTTPQYRDVKANDIPVVHDASGAFIRIISGAIDNTIGPVKHDLIEVELMDIEIPLGKTYIHKTIQGHNAFVYVIDGSIAFSEDEKEVYTDGTLVLFDAGQEIFMTTPKHSARVLFISGKPLHEPVAWRGPIVMNTKEQIVEAYKELYSNTFIKTK